MLKIHPDLNPLEVLVVTEALAKKNVNHYTLLPGNECIWASYGLINEYYIFSKGHLVDIQVDWRYNTYIDTKEHTMTDFQIIVTVAVVAVIFAVKVYILTII